jgi:type IV secretion system protein VirB1
MDVTSFATLAAACAPLVHPSTVQALVSVESNFNPHAIGVVGGTLERQPRSLAEALATTRSLRAHGWGYSVGLTQINARNFRRLGLDDLNAFDPCRNLQAMQTVLGECFERANSEGPQASVRKALSCYYSGNFTTGFAHGYVGRVVSAAAKGIAAERPP